MNGRIFLVGVVINSAKTVGKKWGGGGLKDRRAPWSKKVGGARPQRPNRSLRLCACLYARIAEARH